MSTENEKKPAKSTPKKTAAKAPAKKASAAAAKPAAKAAPKKETPKKAAASKAGTAAKTASAAGIPEAAAPIVTRRQPTQGEIAYRAYFIFIERGGQHGDHEDDWLRAEQELLGFF